MNHLSPSAFIRAEHTVALTQLPFDDRRDFEDATRGFVSRMSPCVIRTDDGRVVWDNDAYDFIAGDTAADTVHPSLWRQSRLNAMQGLYEVVAGIYQVRGFDLANITMIEGDRGVVIIDPLTTRETAAAALRLYRDSRGERPVTGVIYTHSHADHFGGVRGVVSQAEVDSAEFVKADEAGGC